MRLAKPSSLCILALSLIAPAPWVVAQQGSKSEKASSALQQQSETALSKNWRTDPTAFVRLVMGDDLSLRPSATGTTSAPVPDAVQQQIIGARVTWTVARRASPFPTGPRTLLTSAIRQDAQLTGLLVLMPRRIAGDSEVCEAPYRNTAIDALVEISGKVISFKAGVRPDGNIVLVVEVTEVPGCPAIAVPGSTTDLSGTWTHQRSGGRTSGMVQGSLELARESACDSAGFMCYSGTPQIQAEREKQGEKKSSETEAKTPDKWVVGLKGIEVIVCLGNCAIISCVGTLTDNEHIVAECSFLGNTSIGTFKASRTRR